MADMSKNDMMIAIKLLDGTKIYSKDFSIKLAEICLEGLKYSLDGEVSQFVDSMKINKDAIDVYFIIHKGDKEKSSATKVSEDTNDSPTPA